MRKDFDPKMVSLPVKEVELNTTDRLNFMSLCQTGLTVSVDLCNMAYVLDAEFKVLSQFSLAMGEYDILAMCQDYCGTMYVAATNYGINSVNGITRFNLNGKKLSKVILPPTLQEKDTLVTSICTGPGNNMYYRITSVHAVERKTESFICRVGCKSNSSTVIMEEMPFYCDDVASKVMNGIMCHSDGNIYTPKATGISIINEKGEKLRDIATQEMDFSTTDNDGDYSDDDDSDDDDSDDDDSDDDYSDDDDSDYSDSDICVPEASGYILRSSLNGHLFLSKTRSSLIKILSLEGTLLGTINLEEAETSSNNHLIGMDVTSDGYLQVCRVIDDSVIKVFFY